MQLKKNPNVHKSIHIARARIQSQISIKYLTKIFFYAAPIGIHTKSVFFINFRNKHD